ncbi:MAG: MarR family winged helix-turn-helix transcriptional regulator [Solirubrobacteraceae bacterium]
MLRAEAALRRRLSEDLRREGLSTAGFSVLLVLVTAGGELELRALRRRLGTSKPNATEIVSRLQARGLIERRRLTRDRRAAAIVLTPTGRELAESLFPQHSGRVQGAFAALDEQEKRSLTSLCRKLAA